jgi:hypothetical protein
MCVEVKKHSDVKIYSINFYFPNFKYLLKYILKFFKFFLIYILIFKNYLKMIKLKVFSKKVLSFNKCLINYKNSNFSSTKGEEEVFFESREDKELRFEDECYYFEKNWKKLIQEKNEKHQDYFSPDLSEFQEKEVEILSNKVNHMSIIEKQYFFHCLKESMKKVSGNDPSKLNIFRLNVIPKINTELNTSNPNYVKTQNILSTLTPFLASGYMMGGATVAAAPTQTKEAPKQEAKKEEPQQLVKNKNTSLIFL